MNLNRHMWPKTFCLDSEFEVTFNVTQTLRTSQPSQVSIPTWLNRTEMKFEFSTKWWAWKPKPYNENEVQRLNSSICFKSGQTLVFELLVYFRAKAENLEWYFKNFNCGYRFGICIVNRDMRHELWIRTFVKIVKFWSCCIVDSNIVVFWEITTGESNDSTIVYSKNRFKWE